MLTNIFIYSLAIYLHLPGHLDRVARRGGLPRDGDLSEGERRFAALLARIDVVLDFVAGIDDDVLGVADGLVHLDLVDGRLLPGHDAVALVAVEDVLAEVKLRLGHSV